MASLKVNTRITDETTSLFNKLKQGSDINYSRAINGMAQRYDILIKASLPNLSEGEKQAICAAFNGYMLADNVNQDIAGLEWHISESMKYDENFNDILAHHKIDGELLNDRVRSWNAAERLAVIDMTQRFWNSGTGKAE